MTKAQRIAAHARRVANRVTHSAPRNHGRPRGRKA